MSINFNRIWASDTNPDYPTDSQTKRGLSYLGTEAPTFDLHDAIFQDHDLKAQWLYDQIRLLCERYGQSVSESVAGSARDTMANAVTAAILNQRRADEGGYGIVKMADAAQTNAGNDYNFAVSPKHLAEYVSTQNTWSNTKDKPQTALRWPTWDETTNKPTFGSAAWKGFFDTGDVSKISYGGSDAASTGCVAAVRDYAKSIGDSLSQSLSKLATSGNINDSVAILSKDKGGTGRGDGKIDAETVYINSSNGYEGIVFPLSSGAHIYDNKIVAGEDNGTDTGRLGNIAIHSWNGVSFGSVSYGTVFLINCRNGDVRQKGDLLLSNNDAHIRFTNSPVNIVSDDGGYLSLGGGGFRIFSRDGAPLLAFDNGRLVEGSVPIEKVSGWKTGAVSTVYDATYGIKYENLPFTGEGDVPSTGCLHNVLAEFNNRLGSSAWKGFFDTGDAESIPYGADSAASTGCVAAVRDAAKNDTESVRKTLKASAFKGVFDGDFASIPADKELLATARTVSEVRDRVLDVQSKLSNLDSSLDDHSKVGSLVIAMRINDGQQINYPSLTDGYLLRPSACGEYGSDMGPLPGTWKCLGASRWAGDPRGDGSKTTLYRRVR